MFQINEDGSVVLTPIHSQALDRGKIYRLRSRQIQGKTPQKLEAKLVILNSNTDVDNNAFSTK